MDIKEMLSYWKSVLTFTVAVVGATYAILVFAEDQKQLIRAEQQLIHNDLYQESRIDRKKDVIRDNLNLIKAIEADDDELSLEESKHLENLRQEVIQLQKDIEEIRVKLVTHE